MNFDVLLDPFYVSRYYLEPYKHMRLNAVFNNKYYKYYRFSKVVSASDAAGVKFQLYGITQK